MTEIGKQTVALRKVCVSDLETLFRQSSDPESVRMAAFTPEDPDDRQRFDTHMVKVMESPEGTLRGVTWDGDLVGSIASFVVEGQTEVTYWIDRAVWGRGIASQALSLFLELVRVRPLYAGLRATTPALSESLRRLGSEPSARRCPSRPRVGPKSRRPSCG